MSASKTKPGRSKLDAYEHMLGTVPDATIAKLSGLSAASVCMYRNRRGIPRVKQHSGWIDVCPGTKRIAVPNGWLYRVDGYGLCFVPDAYPSRGKCKAVELRGEGRGVGR
jgi:hypothetical protein